MASSLRTLVDALPSRTVLDPLRTRWPGLLGAITPVDRHRWMVVVVSPNNTDVQFTEVASEVQRLFESHGFAHYIKDRVVKHEGYIFWLIEPTMSTRGSVAQIV